jgi:hypothetical protein
LIGAGHRPAPLFETISPQIETEAITDPIEMVG